MWGRKKKSDGVAIPPGASVTSVPADQARLLIEPLQGEWADEVERMRTWVADCVAGNDPPLALHEPAVMLSVIEALLVQANLAPDDTWKLQALGVAFGDAMATDLGIGWCLITDQWGETPGLHLGREDVLYPMTMISKRVENGEAVDVRRLFVTITSHAQELRAGH